MKRQIFFSSLKIFEIKKTSESDLLFEPFFPAPKYSKFTQFSIFNILNILNRQTRHHFRPTKYTDTNSRDMCSWERQLERTWNVQHEIGKLWFNLDSITEVKNFEINLTTSISNFRRYFPTSDFPTTRIPNSTRVFFFKL